MNKRREMVHGMITALLTHVGENGLWLETVYQQAVDSVSNDEWWTNLPAKRRVNLVRGMVEEMITTHQIEFVPGTVQATGRGKLRLVNALERMARSLK